MTEAPEKIWAYDDGLNSPDSRTWMDQDIVGTEYHRADLIPRWYRMDDPDNPPPKDGTVILLGNSFGCWMGKWKDTYTSGFKPENPWFPVMLNCHHMPKGYNLKPTHWRFLPAPLDDAT